VNPQVSLFQTWDWASLWWKHLGKGTEARVLCVQDGGETVGIAPLYAGRTAMGKVLRWAGTGISDRLGIIAGPGYDNGVAQAVAEWLESQPCADLHQLADGSAMARVAEAHGWQVVWQEKSPTCCCLKRGRRIWGL